MPHWVDFLQIKFDKRPKLTNQHIDKPCVDVPNRKQAPQHMTKQTGTESEMIF